MPTFLRGLCFCLCLWALTAAPCTAKVLVPPPAASGSGRERPMQTQGGELYLWSGAVIRFADLLLPEQGTCIDPQFRICLQVLYQDTPMVVDLERFSELEYVSPEVLQATEPSGRVHFLRHYNPDRAAGDFAAQPNCPPQSRVPAVNNFTLSYTVVDPVSGGVTHNSLPFCQVKKLVVRWGVKPRGGDADNVE